MSLFILFFLLLEFKLIPVLLGLTQVTGNDILTNQI